MSVQPMKENSGGKVNRRRLGMDYEKEAAAYLSDRGVLILDKNYRCKTGEIDLIGLDGRYLIFVEIKYRTTSSLGYPAEAVNLRKQRKIRMVARNYLYTHRYPEATPCRFDVVSILGNEINWLKNAF